MGTRKSRRGDTHLGFQKPWARKQWQSADMNAQAYRFYFNFIEMLAASAYKWEGLPMSIDKRFMNLTLLERGLSLFFWDEEYDQYFATMANPSGHINVYNNPVSYHAYGANGFSKILSHNDCVPIWANYQRMPDIDAIKMFARRLADIDRTVDVNVLAQKTPIVAIVPEAQRLSYENSMKQYTGNEPVIITADGLFDPSAITYLSPDAPFVTPELLKAKLTIWGECMTYFGIDNSPIDKLERVQAAEVMSNNAQIEAARLMRLDTMREACKQINEKYGLDVWVDKNSDVSSKNTEYVMMVSGLREEEGNDAVS